MLKSFFSRGWVAGLAVLALVNAPRAQAGQIQYKSVIPDPTWVVHVDADALRKTTVGIAFLEELSKPEMQAKMDIFQGIFSFDPRKALHGLTLYGASLEPSDGVALIYADVDAGRITALADLAGDHHSFTNKSYVIHTWVDPKDREKNPDAERTYATVYEGKVVVFARKESRLMEALSVLSGEKPGLKNRGLFPKPDAESTFTVIQAAARKFDFPDADGHAAIFKLAKSASLQVGESKSNLMATLALVADTEDNAKQISVIAQGLLALASLQGDKGDIAKFMKAISITREGETVAVNLKLAEADAVSMIKSAPGLEKEEKGDKDDKGDKGNKGEKVEKTDKGEK